MPLRNVAVTAMEIATLARLFPGRLITGIGHGVQPWMAQVGARAESPLTLLREYAEALRALLAGGPVTVAGRYVTLDAVELDWPASPAPQLYGGSVGPKSLAVIGELLDGLILDWSTPEQLRSARALVDPLAAAAGRAPLPIVTTLIVASGPGAADRVAAEQGRWDLEPGGFGGIGGTPGEIAAAVLDLAAAGASSVVLQPTADEPDAERPGGRRDPRGRNDSRRVKSARLGRPCEGDRASNPPRDRVGVELSAPAARAGLGRARAGRVRRRRSSSTRRRSLRVLETSHPPVYYVPREDIAPGSLRRRCRHDVL